MLARCWLHQVRIRTGSLNGEWHKQEKHHGQENQKESWSVLWALRHRPRSAISSNPAFARLHGSLSSDPPVLLWLPVSLNECLTSLYFSLLNYYNFSYHYTHKCHSRKSLFTHNNTTKPYKDNSNINYSFHRTRGLRL